MTFVAIACFAFQNEIKYTQKVLYNLSEGQEVALFSDVSERKATKKEMPTCRVMK